MLQALSVVFMRATAEGVVAFFSNRQLGFGSYSQIPSNPT